MTLCLDIFFPCFRSHRVIVSRRFLSHFLTVVRRLRSRLAFFDGGRLRGVVLG
jgi:hypothetical protein